ncbi:ATPase [Candidatus Woesearchaeota archaeon]|nr:ATPase [Candidatus Woesearchaeota archaeon]|tara:strand:- start:3934 stop:5742 length:1809 start_codon:yes stop_codon:yes gene_type:complete
MTKPYITDTSVVIEKQVTKLVKKKEIKGTLLIPKAVIAELENQANKGQETGLIGLEELQFLQKLAKEDAIKLEFVGDRPNIFQIKNAKTGGEIDALIISLAYDNDAILITADKVQAESAKAFGLEVNFIETKQPKEKLEIESFFDEQTMSIHIKEDCLVLGKKGKPGDWNLVQANKEILPAQKVQNMAKEVVEKSRIDPKAFIEISREGSTVVQYKNYRIVITKPPVSDGWEITVVKPLKRLNIEDYKLPEQISERIKGKARGVIIAGETGSGKSTLAQAVAEFYMNDGNVVKTVESPRDLQLPDQITQYSKNFTSSEEIHDILFLSRPDNIIFDEVRDTPDFKLYTDLRLAGSNCLGVLHSASPIDAIQRFIGRMDLGMIPSVLDTILFVEKGNISKVLSLQMVVKVPTGMTEADLARPVVVVTDYLTKKLEYELYSYGEETVVIPVKAQTSTPSQKLAASAIQNRFRKYSDEAEVDVISGNKCIVYVPENMIARIIGKEGKTIETIEKELGINIDIQELKPKQGKGKNEVQFESKLSKSGVKLFLGAKMQNKDVDIYIGDDFLLTAKAGKTGVIKVHKGNKIGKILMDALQMGERVRLEG